MPVMQHSKIDINSEFGHHNAMRTTINLDDDVGRLVKQYAESRSLSLGKALTELARRGLTVQRPTKIVNGLLVFDLPPGSPKVTARSVRRLEAESG